MRHLKIILSVYLVLVVLTGCREKINHEIGIRQIIEKKDTTNAITGKTWQKVENVPGKVYTLKTFLNKLYLGGQNESKNHAFLYSYNGRDMSNMLTGTMIGGPIWDIETVGYRMWFAGNFQYRESSEVYENLMYLENAEISGLEFGNWLYNDISGLKEYKGNLLIRGNFRTSPQNLRIRTSYLERISGGFTTGFGSDVLSEPINDFTVYQNKVYITGKGNLAGNVHLCGFWDGKTLENSGFTSNSNVSEDGYGIVEYKNDLWLSHNKTSSTTSSLVQRFDGTNWNDVDHVSVNNNKKTNLKVIKDHLYFFGTGLLLDGSLKSNILRYEGNKWEAVGNILRTVVDVELYDGKFYAATDDGLYVLD